SSKAWYSMPYMPGPVWTLTHDGRIVLGRNEKYEFDVAMADHSVMRIARTVPPVPVSSAEWERQRDQITKAIRRANDPAWTWNGPAKPASKPAYESIATGTDGSIWVTRYTESREVPNPDFDVKQPDKQPRTVWTSPGIADVFDAKGQYLGAVTLPASGSLESSAGLSLAGAWLITPHTDGYTQVVHYRLTPRIPSRR
ncbi:MAG TPA: hypothetical protein VE967_14445, partial [Gemmatimonadaceae bacterium]|nr:hypothetical protein [Gemmatimonadaceae bacterium]